jgi:signal transduction histidine kinase
VIIPPAAPIRESALEELLGEAAPVCLLVGPEHRLERVNQRFRRAFPERGLDGAPFATAFPDLVGGEVPYLLDDVLRTGQPAVAVEVPGRDGGRPAWWNFLLLPVRGADGPPTALLGIGVDVTAQVESRQRIEALERRSAFLAEASATLGTSLELGDTLVTVAHLAMHHAADWCAVELAAGLGPGAVAAADPELEPALTELVASYPARREPASLAGRALTGQALVLGPNEPFAPARDARHERLLAHVAPSAALAVPLRARGQTLGVMTLAHTRPGARYGASDLALAEELGRDAAVAVDNARLYREAQAAVQVREDFLGIAGHELKTPLTALKLQLQSLQRAAAKPTPPRLDQLHDRLGRMGQQILRLERLMNDLLDVSLVTAGRLRLQPEEVDLRAIVLDVVARQSENLAESGSTVSVDAPAPVSAWVDPGRFEQVVLNLFTNAVKYGRGRPIEVTLAREGAHARLAVRDQGIGIAPEAQSRIFGRFERAVSNRHYGGLGLGLWIVRQIVDASGGQIRFTSTEGEGSTFEVELPLNAPA